MGGGPMSQLQSQQQTPMGGGSSPFNTGGGMSGGFGGGQQTSSPTNFGPMVNYGQGNGGGFGGGQQNNASLLMYPQNQTPYTGNPNQTFNNLMGGLGGWSGGQQQPSMPSFATPGQQSQSPTTSPQVEAPISHFGDMQYRPQQQPDPATVASEYTTPYRPQRQPDPAITQYMPQRHRQQQPEMMMSDMRYRPERQQPFGGQFGQPMQNPFQPQQPSFMQDPEFQGYQTQMQDLNRQMNEYMQKAPMYQQLRDLENKMAPFQQRHQQQEMQRMQQMQAMQQRQFQQPSPFRRGQFQQPMGLMGLMGGRGGMQQPRMSMDMPYARGFASELPTYFMKKGGKV